jgi:hypothetical protein
MVSFVARYGIERRLLSAEFCGFSAPVAAIALISLDASQSLACQGPAWQGKALLLMH